jgi:hypothetical protein
MNQRSFGLALAMATVFVLTTAGASFAQWAPPGSSTGDQPHPADQTQPGTQSGQASSTHHGGHHHHQQQDQQNQNQ